MPQWYIDWRTSMMLLQAAMGVLPFAGGLRHRQNFWKRFWGSTAVGMILFYVVISAAFPGRDKLAAGGWRAFVSVAVYVALICICWISFEENFWAAMFVASAGAIAQDIGGSLKTLYRGVPVFDALCGNELGILVADLISYGLVFLFLFIVMWPSVHSQRGIFGSPGRTIFAVTAFLMCIGMARLTYDNPYRNQMSMMAESIYQIICDILILLVQFGVMERERLGQQVDNMRELMREQYTQFRQSRDSVEIINEKYHDLKGLLESYRGNISDREIDQLKAKVEQYDTFVDTGNEVLDIVLAEKRAVCNQRGIELTTHLNGTVLKGIEDLDLYSLVNNALNNAIDAVSKLPEEDRFILLTISSAEGRGITIHAENPYAGNMTMEKGLPKSQRDARYHGFGMKSMARTAEKYGGGVAVKAKDGMFYLDILLAEL